MKKSKVSLDKIRDLYDTNMEQHGLDSKSVGWPTADSQNLRFKKLLSMVEEPTKPFTINELGCGYGELYKYAEQHGFALDLFHGYDISEKMLEAAKNYLPQERVKLHKKSRIETQADYSIASGIFNVKFEEEADNWDNYIKETLVNMFEHADKGISFNLLTKYVDFEAPNLYYADPAVYFEFCKQELSRFVNLIHDYPLYEWTITVKKA